METARQTLLIFVAMGASVVCEAAQSSTDTTAPPKVATDLSHERDLVDASQAALRSSDYLQARASASEAVDSLLDRSEDEQDAEWLAVLRAAAGAAMNAQDPRTARVAWQRALDVGVATLPDDDPDLQIIRADLSRAHGSLGEIAAALPLAEKVLEVYTRTLPSDDLELHKARMNVGVFCFQLGDIDRAIARMEPGLEFYARTLPDEDPNLQWARSMLGTMLAVRGDHSRSRALLEASFDVYQRTLPDDHPALQHARITLGVTLANQGDYASAHVHLEKALRIQSRALPDDHPELQAARTNMAHVLEKLGDHEGARALREKVYEVSTRTLPEDHPNRQIHRLNLASTLVNLGDHAGARSLKEAALEALERTLPAHHPLVQTARQNLAATLVSMGELDDAMILQEEAVQARSRWLPEDHPDLQAARRALAMLIAAGLAGVENAEELAAGRARCAALVEAVSAAQVRSARTAILESPSREAEERCAQLAKGLDLSVPFAVGFEALEPMAELVEDAFLLSETTRGAALTSARLTQNAAGSSRYAELRDDLRAASRELANMAQQGTTSDALDAALAKRESLERELVRLSREIGDESVDAVELDVAAISGALSSGTAALAFRRFQGSGGPTVAAAASPRDHMAVFVVRARGDTEGNPTSSPLTLIDLGPLAAIEEAARGWRDAIGVGQERGRAALSTAPDPVLARGEALRRLVFDPLLPSLSGAERLVVVLDDVLHLVPLAALPAPAEANVQGVARPRVGDRWRVETRATLSELLVDPTRPRNSALLALGGASFNVPATSFGEGELASIADGWMRGDVPDLAASSPPSPREQPPSMEPGNQGSSVAFLRGTPWERGFEPLTFTRAEARGVAALYDEIFEGERPMLVLERRKASLAALEALADKARFVHIATHGWFAPESVRSWSDPEPLDKQTGIGSRLSVREQVSGMSPMLLCGLALAGANLPQDAVGRSPGLVTAAELSTLDLSGCELVVLSACDTNVGERRAGQGVASLQKALQMAGVQSVITSLWKVPDEATKDLMLDFYRRLWVEEKPKHQALWEAQRRLRDAKDEDGQPRYRIRDWAAWVLTGDPR